MLKLGPILDDFGAHFGDFFGRGRYAKIEDGCIVLRCFADLRGAKKGYQKQMKNKASENMSKNREMGYCGGPFGRLLGHFLAHFLDVGFRLKNRYP